MIKSYRYAGNIDKLLYQNRAEVIDCFEGCLLDSLLCATRRGYMAILETYVNANMSSYTVHFSKNSDDIYNIWDSYTGGDTDD